MVRARDARDWAQSHLRGLCDSLYTPFNGRDGDEIDYEAIRYLVRYALRDLDHDGLWLNGGMGEFWALTMDERKRVAEVAIDEARAIKPTSIIGVATTAPSAKDTVELTQHAETAGADICYVQNPFMESHGGEGVLAFFKYVAERTDIALGMFNSPSSGQTLTPPECARIYAEVPAVCAIKEAVEPARYGPALAKLAPGIVIWATDSTIYNAGYLQQGFNGPCVFGGAAYLSETVVDRRQTDWFNLVREGKLTEASAYYYSAGVDAPNSHGLGYTNALPQRPGYYTHWGSAWKYAGSLLGLPVGDYPHSRAPQLKLTEAQQQRIKDAYVQSGLLRE